MCCVRLLAAAWVVVMVAGCQTAALPLTPLVEGAGELHASLEQVADELEIELAAMPQGPAAAAQFRDAWAARRRSLAALVHFADSLEAIAAAGRDAQATAAAVADAINELLSTAATAPGSSIAVNAGELVTQQLIALRTAANLREALAAAQPILDAYADHLARDIVSLEAIVQLAHAAARLRITTDHGAILSLRAELETQLHEASKAEDLSRAQELTAILLGTEPAYQRFEQQVQAADQRAMRLRHLLREAARRVLSPEP